MGPWSQSRVSMERFPSHTFNTFELSFDTDRQYDGRRAAPAATEGASNLKTLNRLAMVLILFVGCAARAHADGGIQWFGTWSDAVREAGRTGRPILLVAGAPHCHEVPGIW